MRPETQLFLLTSVDGKISTGPSLVFDFDQELPRVPGVAEGLHQYYELEKQTDPWCLVTGRTMEKIYRCTPIPEEPLDVTIVVVDTQYLSLNCIDWLSKKYRRVVIAQYGPKASSCKVPPVHTIPYENVLLWNDSKGTLATLLEDIYKFGMCDKLTIQSGGTLNDALLKAGLIDHINIVVAPLLVGGVQTPTMVDGLGLQSYTNLSALTVLRLVEAKVLENSYLQLRYDVCHDRVPKDFHGVKPMSFTAMEES